MGDQVPTLNVENHKDEYQSFITGLRAIFGNPGSFVRNRPVLPPQAAVPSTWIEVVLRTSTSRLRLRIRRDNLYLDGFRNDVDGAQWFEIGIDSRPHLIEGSRFVGFDGSYGALERAAGVGDQTRLAVTLGQSSLRNSIRWLAQLTDPSVNRVSTAYSLIVIIQMICESVRLQWISDYLTENWATSVNTPTQMIDYETSWGTLSEALIHAEQDPDPQHFRLPSNNLGITNAAGVAAALGILLYRTLPGPSRPPRSIAAPWDDYPKGRPLVEIFWVRVENIDGENPGELYGKILATDAMNQQWLFYRERDCYQEIGPGGHVFFQGPRRSILASDPFSINFDLWDRDADASPDDKIAQEVIEWSPYDVTNKYDQSIARRVDGQYGWVTVNYMVLSNAAEARLEVIMNNGDDEDPANVYGKIVAKTGAGDTLMFDRAKGERVDVSPGAGIPLNRYAVAVPMDKELQIDATLYDWDSLSADDEIANGSAKFTIDLMKSASASIRGQHGDIIVRVSWFYIWKGAQAFTGYVLWDEAEPLDITHMVMGTVSAMLFLFFATYGVLVWLFPRRWP
ncbi:ribosome-inactivating protein [Hypoxylon sp. FL0890]|nr:ribosome-inactivating protein [Hypoxylon sp. FL0890]